MSLIDRLNNQIALNAECIPVSSKVEPLKSIKDYPRKLRYNHALLRSEDIDPKTWECFLCSFGANADLNDEDPSSLNLELIGKTACTVIENGIDTHIPLTKDAAHILHRSCAVRVVNSRTRDKCPFCRSLDALERITTPIFRGRDINELPSTEEIKQWIENGEVDLSPDENKISPLHYAAKLGAIEYLAPLIESGRIDINAGNIHNDTPLSLAVGHGHTECLELLLNSNANVNTANNNDDTPLMLAADRGQTECLKLLLNSNANVNTANNNDDTPLMLAADRGQTECLKLLLDCKANVDTPNRNGSTPLLVAVGHGHSECVRLLLKSNANVNTANIKGNTPLLLAAYYDHTECLKLLLDCKANVDTPNRDGSTPLTLAAAQGNNECQILLENAISKKRTQAFQTIGAALVALTAVGISLYSRYLEAPLEESE